MLSILINAYACSPGMGSEPGMGWNWCVNLAKHCELHIITEGEFRDKIEAAMSTLPHAANMHFYYNPVSEKIRSMCWNQGDWRFYRYYKKWQKKTADMAREICKKEHIDILHQLNMIGFREPGYLWQVSWETGIPFVWGPADAKEAFPMAYTDGASWKTKTFLLLKNMITKYQLKYGRRVHQAAATASLVLSASSNSVKSFKKYFGIDTLLMNETGTYPLNKTVSVSPERTTFDIIWVGKADFRKQLGLAIRSIALTQCPELVLHIVGGGDMDFYKKKAASLGVSDRCRFHGSVTHDEVLELMCHCDLFLFTSVAEGTPHVVLEAIGCNLPILCFDTCGQGDSVTEEIGYKIPLTNPIQSAKDFAEIISYLYNHQEELKRLSENCQDVAMQMSWDNKALALIKAYSQLSTKAQ